MAAIEYRPAQPSDAEAIALLHTRSWRESFRGIFPDRFLDEDLPGERIHVWRGRLDRPPPNQCVRVALDGTELVGFACAYGARDHWGSFIDNLHVAGAAKKAGIGSSLMREAGAWLACHYPGTAVYLLVLETNAAARRFYERLGASNSGVFTTETHGGAMVRSCRYTWARPELIGAA